MAGRRPHRILSLSTSSSSSSITTTTIPRTPMIPVGGEGTRERGLAQRTQRQAPPSTGECGPGRGRWDDIGRKAGTAEKAKAREAGKGERGTGEGADAALAVGGGKRRRRSPVVEHAHALADENHLHRLQRKAQGRQAWPQPWTAATTTATSSAAVAAAPRATTPLWWWPPPPQAWRRSSSSSSSSLLPNSSVLVALLVLLVLVVPATEASPIGFSGLGARLAGGRGAARAARLRTMAWAWGPPPPLLPPQFPQQLRERDKHFKPFVRPLSASTSPANSVSASAYPSSSVSLAAFPACSSSSSWRPRRLRTRAKRPDGEGLGVRALTAMGELVELKVNDWVQYHSATFDKWMMARILDLNIDGTVKIDIKDSADLGRVRALIQVKPGDAVQYDSPTFGEWMDAHVKEVLPNGLISLDIRDEADPSRIYIPLDVHPSMIRQKIEVGSLEGGGYMNEQATGGDYTDFDTTLEELSGEGVEEI